jgi:hypothetical protein
MDANEYEEEFILVNNKSVRIQAYALMKAPNGGNVERPFRNVTWEPRRGPLSALWTLCFHVFQNCLHSGREVSYIVFSPYQLVLMIALKSAFQTTFLRRGLSTTTKPIPLSSSSLLQVR